MGNVPMQSGAAPQPLWYTIAANLFGGLFMSTSVAFWMKPEQMVPAVLSSFDISGTELRVFELAFAGNNVRNFVSGGMISYYASTKNTQMLVPMLGMRLLIEAGDAIALYFLNPAFGEMIPMFILIMGSELGLLYYGRKLGEGSEKKAD